MKFAQFRCSVRLITILAICSVAFVANAQLVTNTYDFASVTATSGTTDPTPPPTATGLTFGSFSSVGYIGSPNASARFSWQTNALGGVNAIDDFSQFTGSIDPARYFEVTLTPQGGFSANIDFISFTIQRSGTGIRNYAVRSSLDSFSANLSASINPANANLAVDGANNFQWVFDANTSAQNGSLLTLGSGFDTLTSPVTFRFYGWNAEQVAGTFSIDNVSFGESATPLPETPTFALARLGPLTSRSR